MFGYKGVFDGITTSLDSQSGIEMPIRFYRAEMIVSYFEAALDPLLALMPHPRLHPIRRGQRKSVVALIQTFCNHASIPPYQSLAFAIPVTVGKWPAPSYLPLLFEESWLNKGFYIHREAVSTSEAYEARTEIWGYPLFLGDINTQMVEPRVRETEVVEEERILSLRTRQPEYVREYPKDIRFYSIKQNIVCENIMRTESGQESSRDPQASIVVFGKHPLGQQFKNMGIGPHSLETRFYQDLKAVSPYPVYLD